MADEYIRLDTTIIAIDRLINEATTGTMARTLFKAKDTLYSQQRYVIGVQPVKRGHWENLVIVPATDTGNRIVAKCSECGDTMFCTTTGREITLKYCANCGARMDGGADDENS